MWGMDILCCTHAICLDFMDVRLYVIRQWCSDWGSLKFLNFNNQSPESFFSCFKYLLLDRLILLHKGCSVRYLYDDFNGDRHFGGTWNFTHSLLKQFYCTVLKNLLYCTSVALHKCKCGQTKIDVYIWCRNHVDTTHGHPPTSCGCGFTPLQTLCYLQKSVQKLEFICYHTAT